ncbi:MAG: hypothetical protein HRT44_11085, partial [Bdellovibrionales bacterium]|nr:hypothetical protein [Bdellovibrionales bacterium]NQZ19784.1 hypothetical protein [Bdellovibrionales bacterium]
IDFSLVVSQYYDSDEVKDKMNRQRRELLRALNKVRAGYAILKQRCEFYQYSSLVYGSRLERSCDAAKPQLEDVAGFYLQLEATSFSARNDYLLEVFREEQKFPYTKDWVTSTTGLLNYMYERANQ